MRTALARPQRRRRRRFDATMIHTDSFGCSDLPGPAHRRMKLRPTLTVLIGLALSALFLWLALRDVDADAIAAALARAELAYALPLLVLLAGFCVAKAWRWGLLLHLP